MAKKKPGKKGESVMGYFRQLFEQHPEWLKETKNAVILDQYRKDHQLPADGAVNGTIKQGLANAKSLLRKGRKAAKRRVKAAVAGMTAGKKMDRLADEIDDCLLLARSMDPASLHRVIEHLRTARNIVVWKMGKP